MKALVSRGIASLRSRENLNTAIYLGSAVFGALVGFVMLRYFTRYLDAEDIGIFGYITSVNAFLIPFITLNLDTFYIKEVYRSADGENRKDLLGTLVLFTLVWSVVLTAILTVAGSLIFQLLEIKFPFFPYMFLSLLGNLGLGTTTFLLLQYRILSKPWSYFAITAAQTVLLIGIGYYLVGYVHWGIYGRILGVCVGSILLGIICFAGLQRHIRFRVHRKTIREGLRFSLPLVPYTLATLLYDMLDRFFLERYSLTMASTGIYNMGAQYAVILSMISMAFYKAYEPAIFKLASEKNDAAINRSMIMLNNVILLIAAPLIFVSEWLINYLTNGRFVSSAYIACLLIVAFYFRSSYIMLNVVLTAYRRTKEIMWFSVFGLLFVILLSVILVPEFNNVGTALIKIALYAGMFVSSYFIVRHYGAFKSYILHTFLTGGMLIAFLMVLKSAGIIR